ncbi:MAG: prepilin-type N-terminal cleavage/methylation domain-containing protein [Rhodocyclaceae bacterium]|nr:prepilin-type N-terminal cleavage/methylation domain-containing protein [Rhodocyclaceae bacterium]
MLSLRGRVIARGFTLVELIAVLILLGILSFVALPRLQQTAGFDQLGFHDRVGAALRFAQKSAVAQRRLVCATVAPDRLALSVATAFGDVACANPMAGPAGANPAALAPSAATTLSAAPAGPLYFQPSGTVTSDGAGANPTDFVLSVTGQAPITVRGVTGLVD